MNETEVRTGVLLVGAGPIGIEMAVALSRTGLEYAHVEAGQIGSTIEWYAPQTRFFSSPERIALAGVPLQTLDQTKATREEYLKYLRAVILQFDLVIHTFERVTRIAKRDDGWFDVTTVRNDEPRQWIAQHVILAIGDMHRPRRLGVPGEDQPHVSHYFGDPHSYFRRCVLIVGGKNSAVEAAIRCVRVDARVTVVHRGEEFDPDRVKFWLLPEIRAMVRDRRLDFLPRTVIQEIRRDSAIAEQFDGRGGSTLLEIPADFVLLLTGYEQDSTLFQMAGVTLEGEGRRPRLDPQTMETDVPGLFVAGTAVAGTQIGGVREFIETSHVHVDRILATLKGEPPPATVVPEFDQPES